MTQQHNMAEEPDPMPNGTGKATHQQATVHAQKHPETMRRAAHITGDAQNGEEGGEFTLTPEETTSAGSPVNAVRKLRGKGKSTGKSEQEKAGSRGEWCRYLHETGTCPFGKKCWFRHT